jgi:methyl-accepting chemotaxis protein
MFRRLRIRGKLLLAVLLPIAALLAISALAIVTFRAVQVNGPEYRRVVTIESLQADLTPQQDFVLVAFSEAQHLLLQAAHGGQPTEVDVANRKHSIAVIDDAERAFRARHAKWQVDQIESGVSAQIVEKPYAAGLAFFTVLSNDFMPQIRRHEIETAQQLNDNLLTQSYAEYRSSSDNARRLLDARRRGIEASVSSLINRRFWTLTLGAFAAVVLAASVGYLLARSVSRRVIRLTQFATRSATQDLPDAIATLQLPGTTLVPTVTQARVDSTDELGELAMAFNAMQDTAVGLATEQVNARKAMAENLVHIGRRNQGLINRTLGFISDLERSEKDPDVLANLFRLDHLTTRMRRGAESLLVLAGSDSANTKRASEEIGDVVRGALSEIEAYDRIELASLEGVRIVPHAVRPIAHLLAELLENAAAFSSPSTKVTVIGRETRAGYHLAVIDRGFGMDASHLAEANKTLASGHEFVTSPTKMLGQRVVARLSERLGIRVRLSANDPGEGITANILVPVDLLDASPNTERAERFAPSIRTNDDHGRREDDGPGSLDEALGGGETLTVPVAWVAEQVDLNVPPDINSSSTFVGFAPPAGRPLLPPSAVPTMTANGLKRRVRGAQLPDLGPERTSLDTTTPTTTTPATTTAITASTPPTPPSRRTAGLGAFQAGVQRASNEGSTS